MTLRPARPEDIPEWLRMRSGLWPDHPDHARDIAAYFHHPSTLHTTLVADHGDGSLLGFIELSRHGLPHRQGTPTTHIEGWWVDPAHRSRGIGHLLLAAAEDWARAQGSHEILSECRIDNHVSAAAHIADGFVETSRTLHFRKNLVPLSNPSHPATQRDDPARPSAA